MKIHTMSRPVLLGLAALAFFAGIEHQGRAANTVLYSTSFEPRTFNVGNQPSPCRSSINQSYHTVCTTFDTGILPRKSRHF
jgi:hypothetical protein